MANKILGRKYSTDKPYIWNQPELRCYFAT